LVESDSGVAACVRTPKVLFPSQLGSCMNRMWVFDDFPPCMENRRERSWRSRTHDTYGLVQLEGSRHRNKDDGFRVALVENKLIHKDKMTALLFGAEGCSEIRDIFVTPWDLIPPPGIMHSHAAACGRILCARDLNLQRVTYYPTYPTELLFSISHYTSDRLEKDCCSGSI